MQILTTVLLLLLLLRLLLVLVLLLLLLLLLVVPPLLQLLQLQQLLLLRLHLTSRAPLPRTILLVHVSPNVWLPPLPHMIASHPIHWSWRSDDG
jgi:hypothetical protein